jgi:hypothetical protein
MVGFVLRVGVLFGLMIGLIPGGAGADERAPMMVLSDTMSFCVRLETQLSDAFAVDPPTAHVRALAESGQALCQHGAVRVGIMRLRRALLFLRAEHSLPR